MTEIYATPASTITHDPGKTHITSSNDPILCVEGIERVFGNRDSLTHALNGVSFEVFRSEFVGIMGPSGSGKTTLLNCISTIDRASGGSIFINGTNITSLSKRSLAKFRRDELGFIFQDSNLIGTLTGYENIALTLSIKHVPASTIDKRVRDAAVSLGVESSLDKYPHQMSGGQRQRVAAARAIVGDPSLILADEPTGALDSRNASVMLDILQMMSQEMAATILMVTHDAYAASFTDRVLFIKDGRIFNEIRRGDQTREDYFSRIMEVIAFLGGDASHAS